MVPQDAASREHQLIGHLGETLVGAAMRLTGRHFTFAGPRPSTSEAQEILALLRVELIQACRALQG